MMHLYIQLSGALHLGQPATQWAGVGPSAADQQIISLHVCITVLPSLHLALLLCLIVMIQLLIQPLHMLQPTDAVQPLFGHLLTAGKSDI